ncbi:metallophosphoesterase [Luedemannella helvata]|uniref:Calcineurin-like phosphoesterase domain-containing protein n=1 Tax=Luedemannella helvata TaxID=349315 RepID=A0ABP4WW20_9ACTN
MTDDAFGTATPRPTSLDPQELGFTPRKPVPWLGPVLLAVTGARVALAEQFGAYLDKRELQNAFPAETFDHSGGEELWFDFVADLGDGFDATYSMAYLLAQPEIEVGGERLPRGRVLVMGGDQVYPTANDLAYEDRFRGPYRAAMPTPPPGDPIPTLYAVPGNHDWYDGLSAFLRTFARREGTSIGGWRTAQTRSYFALKLPQRWWLIALDSQDGGYLDDPQLTYFKAVAEQIQPGDRIILATPNPSWVKAQESTREYDTIDYFLRKVIAPTGGRVALMLSGDLHHYSRYALADTPPAWDDTAGGTVDGTGRQLITCGGGGAYLAATHTLPSKITVPPKQALPREASNGKEYRLARTYPSKARSLALASGVFWRLPRRNASFLALLGLLHTLLMLALVDARGRVLTTPVFLMVAATLGLTLFFAAGLTSGHRATKHYVLGLTHGFVQVALAVAGAAVWRELPMMHWPTPLPALTAGAFYGPVIALLSAQVVALYLLIAGRLLVNVNELFAGQGIQGYKCFLRMHIDVDGSLTVHPIGVDNVSKHWIPTPTAPEYEPWFEPGDPLVPRRIEPPITIR